MKNLPPLEWPFKNADNFYSFSFRSSDYSERMGHISAYVKINLKTLEKENANQTRPQ